MGHMSHDALKSHSPLALQGLDLSGADMAISTLCHGCETGKSTHKPFPSSSKKATQILELVHLDLAGPMQTKSLQGSYYTATFIDDYSSHAVIYFLKKKDQFLFWMHSKNTLTGLLHKTLINFTSYGLTEVVST